MVDATVTLPDGGPGMRLTVAGDGIGIPEGGRRSGLRNVERRAETVGGTSLVGPGIGRDGTGTAVLWEAPYWVRRRVAPCAAAALRRVQQQVPHSYDLNETPRTRKVHDR
ncbi:hypothetical protein FM21_29765 [Streptomyces mutabilis]|uniref:Histidine kinase/HSP90-like ATPase domain-containing protein n=1 Tax=Streptomyces mutabilis TaxID=67332 RepID=A0A086MTW7_9ACTN|nr:hypothetical protein FM21_29765 [Streptomyces mutabilis]